MNRYFYSKIYRKWQLCRVLCYNAASERRACSSLTVEFKARSLKHYFNYGQLVVGDTCEQISFFSACAEPGWSDIAQYFYARRHSIHAEANKSEVRILFLRFAHVRQMQFVAAMENKSICWFCRRKNSLPKITRVFTKKKKKSISYLIFSENGFQKMTFISRFTARISCEYNFVFDVYRAYFSMVLNIRGTFH